MLTASSLFLLGRLGISLDSSYVFESASLRTDGLSAYILPVIENELPEKRNFRGYYKAIRRMNSPYFPERFNSPEEGYSDNHSVIFGPVGNDIHGFAIIPGEKWHVILVSRDVRNSDDQLKGNKRNLKKGLDAASNINPQKGYSLGESAVVPLSLAANDYCSSGLRVRLPSGVILVKFDKLKNNVKPIASDIPKLQKDLKRNLFSFSGFMSIFLYKSVFSKEVNYKGLTGLENATFVSLGDGTGTGFIIGFYQMTGPEKDNADIEIRMEFERDAFPKARDEFKAFVSNIQSLGNQ
jgi:hypothetical protein